MKYTLLELVQDILSSMDSDEVNSITDTVEAQQVAAIVRTCYEEIKDRADLPEHHSLVNLISSADSTKPTLMSVPDNVSEILWIKYNKETAEDPDMLYETITFLPKDQFLDRMYRLKESEDNVGTFEHTLDGSTANILYVNNKHPEYYTTIDDTYVLFDSYDAELDATLQSSKTVCYAKIIPVFHMVDTFIPELDEAQFSLLKNMAKSLAWAELKQVTHSHAERSSSRGWRRLQKKQFRVKTESDLDKLPNFGRR